MILKQNVILKKAIENNWQNKFANDIYSDLHSPVVLFLLFWFLKEIDVKELQIGLNFYWKLFEWIRDRYEKALIDLTSCKNIVLNHLLLSKNQIGFFITSHYPRVLSALGVIFQKKFNPIWSDQFSKN